VTRPRAADDFATIRARLDELRREREAMNATEGELPTGGPPTHSARYAQSSQREIGAGPGRVRQSGPMRS